MGRGKSQASRKLIDAAHKVLMVKNPTSVRGVCYLLLNMKLIPSMAKNYTNAVSKHLKYARRQGIIPWEWIVDETREAEYGGGWENPEDFKAWARESYTRNCWATQPRRVEVWSEKGTVRGILDPVLREYGVTFRVMHGHTSETTLREVVEQQQKAGRPLVVLYVGDWDPSGLDMSERDNPKRLLELFHSEAWVKEFRTEWELKYGPVTPEAVQASLAVEAKIDLRRVALRRADVTDGRLPSLRPKDSDSRTPWFRRNYGSRCWEVDALDPVALRDRVAEAIRARIDWPAWERCLRCEEAEQKSLEEVLGKWEKPKRGQATK